jgi:putative nucleotidyltransferase with HDIG domain
LKTPRKNGIKVEMERLMSPKKFLVVERDPERRQTLARTLGRLGAEVLSLPVFPAPKLDSHLRDGLDLLVADVRLFSNERLRSIQTLKKSYPRLSVLLLAEKIDNPLALRLLRDGVIDAVACPDNDLHIVSAALTVLQKKELEENLEEVKKRLRKLKAEESRSLHRALELEEVYDTTLENLMTALDLRDVETFGHSQTVAKYSQVLAGILGIREKTALDHIRKGALLHDIGKIAIPDIILKKPGSLNGDEWDKIRLHPALGFGLIREIKLVQEVGNIILHHHERYDGEGYPSGLKKDLIPLEARIFALADALDAITSHRPYRKPRDFKAALREIQKARGSQFDPVVVDAFCSLELGEWEKIRYETTSILTCMEVFSDLRNPKSPNL